MQDEAKFLSEAQRKRIVRMQAMDALEPELRRCIHDYGMTVVNAFLQVNIKKPRQIRHIVETVLNEFSPTRGAFSCQGIRTMHEK